MKFTKVIQYAAALFLILIVCGTGAASAAGIISVDSPVSFVESGGVITLPVTIHNADDLGGFQIHVFNDVPGITVLINSSEKPLSAYGDYDITSDASRNYQVAVWATRAASGIDGNHTLFSIDVLTEDGAAGLFPVNISLVKAYLADGDTRVTDEYSVENYLMRLEQQVPVFSGGSGTADDPYIITTAEQLDAVRADLSGSYRLGADINLADFGSWTPIGNSATPFTGTLDGNGCTVTNLQIDFSTGTDYAGLFGYLSEASVTNLTLIANGIYGNTYSGALAGYILNSTICGVDVTIHTNLDGVNIGGISGYLISSNLSRVSVTIQCDTDSKYAGGITGYAKSSTISMSHAIIQGTLTADNCDSAGIAGMVADVIIRNCSASGTYATTGTGGGLVGWISGGNVEIYDSYALGIVTNNNGNGDGASGGLVGRAYDPVIIKNSVALTSSVYSPKNANRVVGYLGSDYNITDTYAITTMSVGGSTSSGYSGLDVTPEQAATQSFYEVTLGWDFVNVWKMDASISQYPVLRMQSGSDPIVTPTPIPTPSTAFSGGSGTADDPYLISSAANLAQLAGLVNAGDSLYNAANYAVAQDIDLSGYTGWTPIGNNTAPFMGVFDGSGYAIAGLTINAPDADDQGLFGHIKNAEIKNVNLTVEHVAGRNGVGGLAGSAWASGIGNTLTIQNCSVAGSITGGNFTGGLAGSAIVCDSGSTLTIRSCYAAGSITGGSSCGGLVGSAQAFGNATSLNIQNSFAAGNVTGSYFTGGFIGFVMRGLDGAITIRNCYATGNVLSIDDGAGGFVGSVYAGTAEVSTTTLGLPAGAYPGTVTFQNSFATGNVTSAGGFAGGFAGCLQTESANNEISILNCCAAGSVTSDGCNVGGLIGYADKSPGGRVNIANSLVLSEFISAGSMPMGRVIGDNVGADVSNTYVIVTIKATFENITDGHDASASLLRQKSFYDITLGWDFDEIWEMNEEAGCPVLRMGGSSPSPVIIPRPIDPEPTPSPTPAIPFSGEGNGTVEEPFEVNTPELLEEMINNPTAVYTLTSDIDMGGSEWTPLGATDENAFNGVFNGGGRVISNFTVNSTSDYQGFIRYAKGATITGIRLKNVNITGKDYVGGIVGYAGSDTVVEDCEVEGNLTILDNPGGIGGIVGNYSGASISGCSFSGRLTYWSRGWGGGGGSGSGIPAAYTPSLGGIVGVVSALDKDPGVYQTTITNCSVDGGIIQGEDYVGGIVGYIEGDGVNCVISECQVYATVIGNNYVGGIAGKADGARIINCVFSGVTSGNANVGGISGHLINNSSVANCWVGGSVNGTKNVGGITGSSENSTITRSVSLIESVNATEHGGRIAGVADDEASFEKNYALDDMIVRHTTFNETEKYENGSNGKGITEPNKEFYNSLGWDFETIWIIGPSGLPELRITYGPVPPTATLQLALVGLPDSGEITVGDVLEILLMDHDLNEIEVAGNVTSSNSDVCTIYGTQLIALSAGAANITANYAGEYSEPITITVLPSTEPTPLPTPTPAVPVTGKTIYVDTAGYAAMAGKTTTLPVMVKDADNIGGFSFSVYNDVPGVTITVSSMKPLGFEYILNSAKDRKYQVITAATTGDGVSGDVALFYIDVEVNASFRNTSIPIAIETDDISNGNGEDVTAQYAVASGLLSVSTLEEIRNTVTNSEWSAEVNAEIIYELHPYFASIISAPEITHGMKNLTLTNLSVEKYTSDGWLAVPARLTNAGTVSLTESVDDALILHVKFTGRKLGDITGDNRVSSGDKVRLGQHIAELNELDEEALFYADILEDGKVNSGDKIKLGQYVAELLNSYYKIS